MVVGWCGVVRGLVGLVCVVLVFCLLWVWVSCICGGLFGDLLIVAFMVLFWLWVFSGGFDLVSGCVGGFVVFV